MWRALIQRDVGELVRWADDQPPPPPPLIDWSKVPKRVTIGGLMVAVAGAAVGSAAWAERRKRAAAEWEPVLILIDAGDAPAGPPTIVRPPGWRE